MATPLDPLPSPPSWSNVWAAGQDGPAGNDAERERQPFPPVLPASLVEQGWTLEDYFGRPAACHRTHGVVTLVDDGFLACPRNGRPHAGIPDLLSACQHCATAQPADPEAPCPLVSVLSDLVSGPSLLATGFVALAALVLGAWVHHGWPF